jgi:hypothetical protein
MMEEICPTFLLIKFRQKENARLDANKIQTANFGPGLNRITAVDQRFAFRKKPLEEEEMILK